MANVAFVQLQCTKFRRTPDLLYFPYHDTPNYALLSALQNLIEDVNTLENNGYGADPNASFVRGLADNPNARIMGNSEGPKTVVRPATANTDTQSR